MDEDEACEWIGSALHLAGSGLLSPQIDHVAVALPIDCLLCAATACDWSVCRLGGVAQRKGTAGNLRVRTSSLAPALKN